MSYLVAIWAIMMGIVRVVGALADHEALPHAWLVALAGVVSVLFGIAMCTWPGVRLLTLVYLVGIYASVRGGLLADDGPAHVELTGIVQVYGAQPGAPSRCGRHRHHEPVGAGLDQ